MFYKLDTMPSQTSHPLAMLLLRIERVAGARVSYSTKVHERMACLIRRTSLKYTCLQEVLLSVLSTFHLQWKYKFCQKANITFSQNSSKKSEKGEIVLYFQESSCKTNHNKYMIVVIQERVLFRTHLSFQERHTLNSLTAFFF